jgi:hypothetical protein
VRGASARIARLVVLVRQGVIRHAGARCGRFFTFLLDMVGRRRTAGPSPTHELYVRRESGGARPDYTHLQVRASDPIMRYPAHS